MDAYADIPTLHQMLKTKKVSSLELTRFYLDRLAKHGERLGAVVTITRERAEGEAKEADKEVARGRWRSRLQGIPYGVKDLLATRGIPTTWGAEPYRNQVFDFDATVVRKLTEAGGVLCAKLAMVELAGGFGYNHPDASFTGPGRSPWNLQFWSGGSSSGPGAAVGAGLLPYAIGSETSGSILTPSAFSGVSGLRPTYGMVSRHGAMSLCWTLDKIGPMARTAFDCGTILSAIAGRDPADPTSLSVSLDWQKALPSRKWKFATVKGTTEKVQPEVRANFTKSVEIIRSLGHEITEIEFPDMPFGPVVGTIVDAEGASAFEDILRDGRAKQLRVAQDRIGGFEAAATLAVDYIRAMRVRKKIRMSLLDLLAKHDFVIGPTRATVAYPIDKRFDQAYPGISGGPSLIGGMNLAGAPALALPNGFGENGLPTSLQIIAAPLRERELVSFARAIQERTDWHTRVPKGFE